MSPGRDVALVGTGIAPLIAAQILMRRGWRVLILNPEHDFFTENSELPFHPGHPGIAMNPGTAGSLGELELLRTDRSRSLLEPEFPGALESWPREKPAGQKGDYSEYFDPRAPFLRTRNWTWIELEEEDGCFLEFSERGWHPSLSTGVAAARRFPGFTIGREDPAALSGLTLPKMADVDVVRFRNGVLEFVRSRDEQVAMVTGASSIEPTLEGVRFYAGGVQQTIKLAHGIWVFRTPRLNSWLSSIGITDKLEAQVWEEWTLVSRDPLDPGQLGFFGPAAAYARCEGLPGEQIHELCVMIPVGQGEKPAGAESFKRLGVLVQQFLNWDRFKVRDLQTRTIGRFLPEVSAEGARGNIRWMAGADGALASVVARVGRFCEVGGTGAP